MLMGTSRRLVDWMHWNGRLARGLVSRAGEASGVLALERRELLAVDFVTGNTSNLAGPASIIADFDGDGDGDIAVTSGVSADMLRIYRNNGNGSFALTDTYDLGLAVVDFARANVILPFDADNDGDIDLLTKGPALWRNNGNGTFAQPFSLIAGALVARDLAVINFDGNNLPDLITIESTGRISILNNIGSGAFVLGVNTQWDGNARFVGIGPTPGGGGRQDAYAYEATSREVRRIINQGGTSLGLATAATDVLVKPTLFLTNADQLPDLLSIEGPTGQREIKVRYGQTNLPASVTFGAAQTLRSRGQFDYSLLSGFTDVDNDGKLDLITFRERTGSREWVALLGNAGSDGNFDGAAVTITTITGSADPGSMLGGRVDNDTRADVLRINGNQVINFRSATDVQITSFTGPTGPTVPGEALNLQSTVTGGLTSTNRITFYVDSNRNGRFDMGDRSLGSANNAGGYDLATFLPDGLPAGQVKLFALAADAAFGFEPSGNALSSIVEINANFWTRVFYAEGFRTLANVNEHVPIVNPNDVPVAYRVILRYESGDRDQVFIEGILPPRYRGGITTNIRGWTENQTEGNAPVRVGVGYAFEVQSELPIGAQLARYDTFGSATPGPGTGESFTNVVATQWAVAEVSQRNFDFILFYNPYPVTANITMTFVDNNGSETIITRTVEAFRRSGIAVQEEASLNGFQTYSVIIASDQPIVTVHTRYNVAERRGLTNLAQALDPVGLPASFDNYVMSGIELRTGVVTNAFFFNPSETQAINVTLRGRFEGTPQTTINNFVIQPRRRISLALNTLAPGGATSATFRVTSDNGPVYVSSESIDTPRTDSNATTVTNIAARRWAFSDGYLSTTGLGTTYIENVSLFNPNASTITITFTFVDSNGLSTEASFDVLPETERMIPLHTVAQLINRPTLNWFSTIVSSPDLFIATLTHWDLSQPGGWTTIGSPLDGVFAIPTFDPGGIAG